MIKKLYIGLGSAAVTLSLLSGCSSQQHTTSPAAVTDANNLFGRNGSSHATTHAINQPSDQFSDQTTGELAAGPHQGLLATRRIYFGFNSYSLERKYLPAIQAHANYLKNHSKAQVLLEGNTDARGSRNYNLALGQRRADAVANQLKADGVSTTQIHTISYGKERPIALGNNSSAYAKNRRTDLVYVSNY
ncbi:MAG: peptidoglycan-associated lipoprotein Pal [Gammaproteobacteria bacterium]|nr:peptidoglycan-associated lipoprotein Pal [Gammaproteobacteria bacterium]